MNFGRYRYGGPSALLPSAVFALAFVLLGWIAGHSISYTLAGFAPHDRHEHHMHDYLDALEVAGGVVLVLALALGSVARQLGTGVYVARVTTGLLPPVIFLPLVFLVAAIIGFATGTSWGTFAIMLPIAVPAAQTLGLPLGPFIAAALSGGVFGDHASPISDTTIISSMAAATDHIDHVRTQLPYALLAAAVAVIGFAIVGASM